MRCVKVTAPGSVTNLEIGETVRPKPSANELLIKVASTAVNRADILQREGKYPPPEGASDLLGLELSGTVDKVGTKVKKWKVGDRVFGLVPGGGYAEYALLHEDLAIAVPEKMDFHAAAAIPETFLTAYQALAWTGKLQKDETVLIHAGASGVGTAAIQLAKKMGARVMVTASAQKLDNCKKIGADVAIDYEAGPFKLKVLEHVKDGVDVIIDFIGAPYFQQNIDCLAKDGRMVMLAGMGGMKLESVNLNKILLNRLTIAGSTLRSRTTEYQAELTSEFMSFAYNMLSNGEIRPIIDKVFPIREVAHAHRYMEANRNVGKIVLQVENMF